MNLRRHLGITTLLVPIFALLGTPQAFAAAYPFSSMSASVISKSDTTNWNTPTGSFEYLISFNLATNTDFFDPTTEAVHVFGGVDQNSPLLGVLPNFGLAFPPDCFEKATDTFINSSLSSLTCMGDPSQKVNLQLLVPGGGAWAPLDGYVTKFTAQLTLSKSTGHGYLKVLVNFSGFDPGTGLNPASVQVRLGDGATADGAYVRLDTSRSAKGSR